MMSMQQLKSQNKKLKELHANCIQELEKLKQTGRSHEAQIDTLLKFNERLLGIIQNEFNSATKSKISSDLQIIAQTNQQSTDLSNHPAFKSRLAGLGKSNPQGGNYQQNQVQGLEEEEEQQEQIYNHQKQHPSRQRLAQAPVQPQKKPPTPAKKGPAKLDHVFEQQQKGLQESINLTSSINHSNPSTNIRQLNGRSNDQNTPSSGQQSAALQQIKEMIKEYKQEFVENSAQYEQICSIIHTDLLRDFDEFKRICQQSNDCFQQKMFHVSHLKKQIGGFKPVQKLINVMRRLKVPPGTERLLYQKIISKHS